MLLISVVPRFSKTNVSSVIARNASLTWMRFGTPCDSMRAATFTASPHASQEKRVSPITPAVAWPQCSPMRSNKRPPPSRWQWSGPPEVPARAGQLPLRHPVHRRQCRPPPCSNHHGLDLIGAGSLAQCIKDAHDFVEVRDHLIGG